MRSLQAQLPKITDSTVYLDKLNLIGFMMHMKSADSCLSYGIKAKSMADRHNYPKGKADAICNIATALFLKGAYSQALDLYAKAMREYESIPNSIGTVNMLMNSAVVYDVLGDSSNSLKFSQLALNKAAALPPDSTRSMLYANYELLRPQLNPDSADYYLNKAEQIARRFKYDRALLFVKQLKSDKLLKAGRTQDALQLIQQSLQIAQRHHWEYHEIVGLSYYGAYFLKLKKIDSAIACYDRSYALAAKNGFITFKIEVLKSLLDCYRLTKDEKELARTNNRLVQALEEEKNNNKNFIGDYITYYNTQQEINLIEKESTDKQRIIWLLIGFSVLSIGTIAVMYSGYKKLREHARLQLELNKKITEQNALLTQSDEFKAKLVSMLAHDFRSPLNSTLNMVTFMKEDFHLTKEEMDLLHNSLQTEVETILRTFDNILQWVKKQYAGYSATAETLMANSLIEEAALIHHSLMQSKKVTLFNRIDTNLSITTDKEVIQFVNRNLIHNAIKFSPEGGSITIDARYDNGEFTVSVRDEGTGMTKRQLDQLFSFATTKYSQVDQSAGVALTICKEFITKLNGRIWAESVSGSGTTFFYVLPQPVSSTVNTMAQVDQ
ncbi:tetratricopeptide repeat-containing sensor histidine kinase [Larkinella harenae]